MVHEERTEEENIHARNATLFPTVRNVLRSSFYDVTWECGHNPHILRTSGVVAAARRSADTSQRRGGRGPSCRSIILCIIRTTTRQTCASCFVCCVLYAFCSSSTLPRASSARDLVISFLSSARQRQLVSLFPPRARWETQQ